MSLWEFKHRVLLSGLLWCSHPTHVMSARQYFTALLPIPWFFLSVLFFSDVPWTFQGKRLISMFCPPQSMRCCLSSVNCLVKKLCINHCPLEKASLTATESSAIFKHEDLEGTLTVGLFGKTIISPSYRSWPPMPWALTRLIQYPCVPSCRVWFSEKAAGCPSSHLCQLTLYSPCNSPTTIAPWQDSTVVLRIQPG